MSEFSRLTGVFFEPGKTFADIVARPRWLVPMLLLILIGLAATVEMSQRVGWERIVRHSVETSSRAQSLDAQQKERNIEMGVKIASVTAYLGPIVGVPIYLLVVAGVLLGIFAGILSAPIKFKQAFAVVAYANLPGVISGILLMVVMLLKNPDEFNVQNPLAFNPGAYMDPLTSSKSLYSLATSLDLFTLWVIVLLAIGFKSAAGRKLSFAGAFLAVFLPWCVWVGGKAALAGLF
ncbi:MAG: YIP1 family protein [Bryobacteraceae bacterium]